jgi:hypothetical protein
MTDNNDLVEQAYAVVARVDDLNREVNRLRIALGALYRQVAHLAQMTEGIGNIPANPVHEFCVVAANGARDALDRRP